MGATISASSQVTGTICGGACWACGVLLGLLVVVPGVDLRPPLLALPPALPALLPPPPQQYPVCIRSSVPTNTAIKISRYVRYLILSSL